MPDDVFEDLMDVLARGLPVTYTEPPQPSRPS
jgi:hypothetical protein